MILQANFLANDMKDVRRNLPTAINTAMTVVVIVFQLANISYYIILPWKTLAADDAVAVVRSLMHSKY
jgi:solute carrier family 7 (L-type amino acid transporter), member 9/15